MYAEESADPDETVSLRARHRKDTSNLHLVPVSADEDRRCFFLHARSDPFYLQAPLPTSGSHLLSRLLVHQMDCLLSAKVAQHAQGFPILLVSRFEGGYYRGLTNYLYHCGGSLL